ncbi:MAG: GNAT family N-acetyltransferase [Nitrococcus sp.]|nr:GNAT family N-acetyltransferase [Nitrococcus sp.]
MTIRALRDEAALVAVERPQGTLWSAFTTLYLETFRTWEREPLPRIARRLAAGRYRLAMLQLGDEPAGFYLLDRVAALDYAALTFLALRPSFRGRGLGRRLLQHALSRFQAGPGPAWLFVEAEAEPAGFYRHCGLRQLVLDYRVPHYASVTTMQPMALLTVHRDGPVGSIDGKWLRRVVKHLFVDGYQLSPDDPRLAQQLQQVPDVVGVH